MGFAAGAARKPVATMLCLLCLAAEEVARAVEAAALGADGVILEGVSGDRLKEIPSAAISLPLGVRPVDANAARLAAQSNAGADFLVLDTGSVSAEVLAEERIGLVLGPGPDLPDTTLRLLGDLPLDALLMPAPPAPLTLERLLELRRYSALTRLPILLEAAGETTVPQLRVLRDAGVVGLVLDAAAADRLPTLKEAILSLPPRGRRRVERPEALLPAQVLVAATEEEEEERLGKGPQGIRF